MGDEERFAADCAALDLGGGFTQVLRAVILNNRSARAYMQHWSDGSWSLGKVLAFTLADVLMRESGGREANAEVQDERS